MDNKERALDIYLMGIGGTGMGAFAGLLKRMGHRVTGSDNAVYSPMKEKLSDWGITYKTPYDQNNVPKECDLVIVGNVIRKDNPEAQIVFERNLAYDSFPHALNRFFLKQSLPIVASGTHGKTTCAALLAHTLYDAGFDPGFLVGGIPINFGESFRASKKMPSPFVIEGDEYDTAFFDKQPKFMHYAPKYLLLTSLEFDHGDIYADLDAVISAFAALLQTLIPSDVVVVKHNEKNILAAISKSQCKAKILTYGEGGDFEAVNVSFDDQGVIFQVKHGKERSQSVQLSLFGEHNLNNALGCYTVLMQYGLTHEQIAEAFPKFLGTKRRLEQKKGRDGRIVLDDFAHHPTAVRETIKAARQKFPGRKIAAIFEPRSATSCMKVFEKSYQEAFLGVDKILLAPLGRSLAKDQSLDTKTMADGITNKGFDAKAFTSYDDLRDELATIDSEYVFLFMSNGDLNGLLKEITLN